MEGSAQGRDVVQGLTYPLTFHTPPHPAPARAGRDAVALAHLRDIVPWQIRRFGRRQVRFLIWSRLCLRDWRRQVRLWRNRNVRLRRIRVGNVRNGNILRALQEAAATR
jgi:hypothetical protein